MAKFEKFDSTKQIRGLADAARKIAREQSQIEEASNYFEVLRFFQNPPHIGETQKFRPPILAARQLVLKVPEKSN